MLIKKAGTKYRKYHYITYENKQGREQYSGKGYVKSEVETPIGGFTAPKSFVPISDDMISKDYKTSLNQMIQYCKDKNIELHFFSAPMSDFELANVGNYDSYIRHISNLLNDSGMNYVDFNLCKPEYMDLNENDFLDYGHLNGKGADKFSTVFSQYYNGEIRYDDLFYKSYQEKLDQLPPEVFGIIVEKKKESVYEIMPVVNGDLLLRYTVNKTTSNGEKSEIQTMSTNSLIEFPEGEHGIFRIYTYLENGRCSNFSVFDY